MRCTSEGLALVVAAAITASGGCAERGAADPRRSFFAADLPDGTEIAVRGPGSRVVLLAVRPPYAVGPSSQIVIKNGRISGQHRGAAFVLQTSPGSISGSGPGGAVEMDVWGDDYQLNAEGSWNGSVGRFRLDPEGLRISAASGPSQVICGRVEGARYFSARYRRTSDGFIQTQGPYVLQEHTLEIGPRLTTYLSREEIIALLMTVLSDASARRRFDPIACGPSPSFGRRYPF
jgi:hypothetical protein